MYKINIIIFTFLVANQFIFIVQVIKTLHLTFLFIFFILPNFVMIVFEFAFEKHFIKPIQDKRQLYTSTKSSYPIDDPGVVLADVGFCFRILLSRCRLRTLREPAREKCVRTILDLGLMYKSRILQSLQFLSFNDLQDKFCFSDF